MLTADRPNWREVTTRHNAACWKGYERVPGTKEHSNDSCRKKGSKDDGSASGSYSSESDSEGGRRKKKRESTDSKKDD